MMRSSLPEARVSMQMRKPGIIMEAFCNGGESSNLVFIINELDKAASGKGNGNPADVLLNAVR